MFQFLLLLFISPTTNGFLLDSSSTVPTGGALSLTDRHYIQLMDSLYQERKARQQLEQIVQGLQTKLQTGNSPSVAPSQDTRLNDHESRIARVEQKYSTMSRNYERMQQEINNIMNILNNQKTCCKDEIAKLTPLLHNGNVNGK